MRNFRPWFNACFFWAPIAVTLLLNTGRNAINIPHFSVLGLLTLATCGITLVFYSTVGFIQPRRMSSVFLPEPARMRHMMQFLLSLLLGLIAVYDALKALAS